MTEKKPTTSSFGRVVKIGSLMGRVGTSVATERAIDFAFSGPTKQLRRTENLVKNAARIVETLGEMKGAAMKVGQMLSLHESMLPPEVAEVLSLLQQKAPSVPSEVMRYEVEGALRAPVTELFAAAISSWALAVDTYGILATVLTRAFFNLSAPGYFINSFSSQSGIPFWL